MQQKNIWSYLNHPRTGAILEILIIIVLAMVPALLSMPYKVGIYLSWEGAYRISEGQIPFRDFGLPMGGYYWVIPAVFFKLFGPTLISLAKAQVFINILAGLAFRSILKSLSVASAIRISGIIIFCLSYSFRNYWPWYNHTVIVFGFMALAFLLRGLFAESSKKAHINLLLAGTFTYISFFTKQDGGGLIFFICLFLVLYTSWLEKKWSYTLLYLASFAVLSACTVLYFSQWDFHYWFNYGQPPHNARVDKSDILNTFFVDSSWLRFYVFITLVLVYWKYKDLKSFISDKQYMIFLLLTMGILCMAAIYQVTSYTPEECNIFFHAFAYVFIISNMVLLFPARSGGLKFSVLMVAGAFLLWSQTYWLHIKRLFIHSNQVTTHMTSPSGENVVNMHNAITYKKDPNFIDMSQWVFTDLPTLKRVKVPPPTAEGIKRLMAMDVVKNTKDMKVLNMSELTTLAKEIPYKLEAGPGYPLWYHLGVGMFNREAEMFEKKIKENYYDLVLFEDLPELNNFYPYRVQKVLQEHYEKVDAFLAPRSTVQGFIEVYVKKQQ